MAFTYSAIEELPLTLNAEDISRKLNISRTSTYNLMHTEGFPILKVGKLMLIPRDKFLSWMNEHISGNY